MALERHPIQNSEVYVLNGRSQLHQSRPAPPSPPTPCETRAMSPVPDKLMIITPPAAPMLESRLSTAIHVLRTEAKALSRLTNLYQIDHTTRGGFNRAVDVIRRAMDSRGKLVISGVGKSGHIGRKLVATMNSLRISSTFLHPTEALHGDLGKVGDHDVVLLVTYSGRTPELLALVPHLNPALPLLLITSHTNPSTCVISDQRPDAILLPAPIHESETDSFGVSAPTTSTTVALAIGDALAIAVSEEMYPNVSEVFIRNHPGGAIGQAALPPPKPKRKISDLTIPLSDIPFLCEGWGSPLAMHVIISGYQSPSGWVRYSDGSVVPPRRIRRLEPGDMEKVATKVRGLVVSSHEWISVPADISVKEAIAFLASAKAAAVPGVSTYDDDAVITTTVDGTVTAVVEVATLLDAAR